MTRPVGDVAARGVVEIGEATSTTISGYTFTTVVALLADTPIAEWQDRGTRVFAIRQDGRHYLKPLTSAPTASTGDLWLENQAGVTHLRYQGLQGLVTVDTGAAVVTSVGLAAPTQFSVSGSPVTSAGTLSFAWVNQAQNQVLAGPTSGSAAPTFRALVAGDIPALAYLPASGGTTGYLTTWSSSSALGSSQYLPAANHPALTGDVTSSNGSLGTVIAAGAVSLAKMANLAANSIIGNNTGSPATPLALTAAQVKTLLAISSSDVSGLGFYATGTNAANLTGTVPAATLPLFTSVANGAVPLSGGGTTNFLRADGTWATPLGSVTSVGLSLPAIFSVSGSPVTSSGTLTGTLATQTANTLWAGPTSGGALAPTFRALVGADFPALTVPIGSINASGTASSTTYLRGDGQWAAVTTGLTGTAATGKIAYGASSTSLTNSPDFSYGSFTVGTGGIVSGVGVTVGSSTASSAYLILQAQLSGTTPGPRGIVSTSANKNRWNLLLADGLESGTQAGSDVRLQSFTDAGAYQDDTLVIPRAKLGVGVFNRQITSRVDQAGAPSEWSFANQDDTSFASSCQLRIKSGGGTNYSGAMVLSATNNGGCGISVSPSYNGTTFYYFQVSVSNTLLSTDGSKWSLQGTGGVQIGYGTQDGLLLAPQAVGTGTNTITLTTPTTALGGNFVQTFQAASGTLPLLEISPCASFQNKLINPRFDFWQRGTSVGPAGGAFYGPDRWVGSIDGTGTLTFSRVSLTLGSIPNEPTYAAQLAITTLGTSTVFALDQRVEGVRTFAGKTVIMSFWARADAARTLNLRVSQVFGSGGSPSSGVFTGSGTASLTTSFQKFTYVLTVPSISGKTLGTNGDDYLAFSTYLLSAAGAYIQITDAEFKEVATSAQVNTPFETRPRGVELQLCQRYYQSYVDPLLRGVSNSATQLYRIGMQLPVTMRAVPTSAVSGSFNWTDGAGTGNIAGSGTRYTSTTAFEWDAVLSSGTSAGGRASCTYLGGGGVLTLSAEL